MNGNSCSNMMSEFGNKGYDFQQQERTPAQMPAAWNQHQMTPAYQGPMAPAMPPASTAPTTYNQMQMTPLTTIDMSAQPPLRSTTPTTLESTYYIAGLLNSFVGSRVRVQFLLGTSAPLVDVLGTLMQVGANYIVIQPVETDDLMVCDMFSIKFVTVFR